MVAWPRSFGGGSATDSETVDRENLLHAAPGAAAIAGRAYMLATGFGNELTIASGFTKVPLDTLDYDTNAAWDLANNRYVVPTTGYYQVNVQARVLAFTAGAAVTAFVRVNGVNKVVGNSFQPSQTGSAYAGAVAGDVVSVTVGDHIEFWINLSTGTGLILNDFGPAEAYMSVKS